MKHSTATWTRSPGAHISAPVIAADLTAFLPSSSRAMGDIEANEKEIQSAF